MNLDEHILKALAERSAKSPMTIGDLARQLGVNPFVVMTAAKRLVDGGKAIPTMADVRGVPTLRGLQRVPAPVPTV